MQFMVKELRYAQLHTAFVNGLQPYAHQVRTLQLLREAIERCQTICIENTSVTGSGKTLANFAAAILDGVPTCGVYPTNELMLDQGVSLDPYLRKDIALLDSQGLDDIQAEQEHMRTHAHALAWATGDQLPLAILTNPDVLHLAMYNLYGQMFSTFARNYGNRIFQNMLANYPVIAFDEFHLYNAKQIANAAFLMGTMKELAPSKPHIFIFSSATPQEQFKRYVQRLGIEVFSVGDTPSTAPGSQVVCEQLHIHLLPADLLHWKGGDVIREHLEEIILPWADHQETPARGVFIVDSVYEAKRIAADLHQRGYPSSDIGEVHGYMAKEGRTDALHRRFSVGTTTIDVGVDLTGVKSKDFLVCEARSAAQAIQRIGRLGRHRREARNIPIPNTVWLAVPEYVSHYIAEQGVTDTTLTRDRLNSLLNEAYLGHENFFAYTRTYAPLEAIAACERILPQHFTDNLALATETMHRLIPTLYNATPPTTQEQAEQDYARRRRQQRAVWRKFGIPIKGSQSKDRFFLSDLESFRGGLESDFTVAVYDDLDQRIGLPPVKTYSLPFIMRRTQYTELSEEQFTNLVKRKHPQQAEVWLEKLKQQANLLGYVHVQGLVDGRANEVYFEVSTLAIENNFHQVIRLSGFTIDGDNAKLRSGSQSITSTLRKRSLNCWVSEQSSFTISETKRLPPLFELYPLHALLPNGRPQSWTIAFGLNAFFLEGIMSQRRRTTRRTDDTAIIL